VCSRDVYALCPNKVSENNQLVSSKVTFLLLFNSNSRQTNSNKEHVILVENCR